MKLVISNCIIYLIGFAGVGKLTIAKEILAKEDFKLVDNHLINNPILSVVGADGKTRLPDIIWDKVKIVRDTVLDTIVNVSPSHFNFIFSNELIEGAPRDLDIYNKIQSLAKQRNSKFLPVRLICDEAQLCKRVCSEERKANFKDIDVQSVHLKYQTLGVLNPKHPNVFTLDVTHISPSDAAQKIIAKIQLI